MSGAQGSAVLARSRSSISSDLLSDKRYWERLVSSPPVVAAKNLERFNTRGLNPRYCIFEYAIGLTWTVVAFSPLLKCRHFCAQSNAASACALAAEQSAAWIDRGTAIQRSSSPARWFNAFLHKMQTHAQKLQREQKNAGCMPGLGSNFIAVIGAYVTRPDGAWCNR